MRYTGCSRAAEALGTLCITASLQAQVPFGLGEFEWVERFSGDHGAYDCAYDPWGNIYITGYMSDSVNFADTTFYCPDYMDFFLVKLDSTGEYIWGLQANATYAALSREVQVDSNGNPVVGVVLWSDLIIGSDTIRKSAGYYDLLILKFDPLGNLIWHVQSASPEGGAALRGISVDSDDNVIAVCQSPGLFVVYGQDTITPIWDDMINIVKYDSDGNHLWTQRIDEDYNPGMAVEQITTDEWGNVYTFCRTYGNTNFGGQFSFSGSNVHRLTLVKITSSGEFAWVQRLTDQGSNSTPVGVATHGDKVYVTGTMLYALPFGPYHFADSTLIGNRFVAFLAQFDTAGTFQWIRYGYHGAITASSVVVSEEGLITMLGGGTGPITFPDTVLTGWNGGTYYIQYNEHGDRLDLRGTGTAGYKNAARAVDAWQDKLVFYGDWADSSYFPTDPEVAYLEDPARNGFLFQLNEMQLPVGLADEPLITDPGFHLYPNPTTGHVTVRCSLPSSKAVVLTIMDPSGRVLKQTHRDQLAPGSMALNFNVQDLADGVYLINLLTQRTDATRKLIVRR